MSTNALLSIFFLEQYVSTVRLVVCALSPFLSDKQLQVSGWYTLVIFTASMREYADPVIDWLDAGRGILAQRLFRDVCPSVFNLCCSGLTFSL